jgi:hypothetical protein
MQYKQFIITTIATLALCSTFIIESPNPAQASAMTRPAQHVATINIAPMISRFYPCPFIGVFHTISNTGDTCWENTGMVVVALYNVRTIETNWSGGVYHYLGPDGYWHYQNFYPGDIFPCAESFNSACREIDFINITTWIPCCSVTRSNYLSVSPLARARWRAIAS